MKNFYLFCCKIQQIVRVTYIYVGLHPKNNHISNLDNATTLISGSRKGAVGYSSHIAKVSVKATC